MYSSSVSDLSAQWIPSIGQLIRNALIMCTVVAVGAHCKEYLDPYLFAWSLLL